MVNTVYEMDQVARDLNVGRNNLYKYLRAKKVLIDAGMHRNTPYQKYINDGYFEVRYDSIQRTNGAMPILQTLVTPAGVEFIKNMIGEDPIENYR